MSVRFLFLIFHVHKIAHKEIFGLHLFKYICCCIITEHNTISVCKRIIIFFYHRFPRSQFLFDHFQILFSLIDFYLFQRKIFQSVDYSIWRIRPFFINIVILFHASECPVIPFLVMKDIFWRLPWGCFQTKPCRRVNSSSRLKTILCFTLWNKRFRQFLRLYILFICTIIVVKTKALRIGYLIICRNKMFQVSIHIKRTGYCKYAV